MKIRRVAVVASCLAGAALLAFLAPRVLRRTPDFAQLREGQDFNVILITLDTTRADRIGCYGFPDIQTPTIDTFASRGVRFEKCYAQTPLTLPSHTTLMTGTLPLFHGVRDNGGFIVPGPMKTMAELFKDKGYATGAFVAAYVLDSKWGLNQGFDTYYDNFDLSKFKKISLGTVQRPANEVMDKALPWLESQKEGKFFAWIHLYDPHTPYEPPPPYDTLYPDHPYLGEIAFADSELGRMWRFLESNGLLRKTFIVFAGDHGESLGEHEEHSHGFFVYQGAIHVPLIIVTPFARFQGVTSTGISTLADVLPTVCEMTGLPVPSDAHGRSLLPSFGGSGSGDDVLAYSETYYPRFHYGWSELKAVQNARYKLILAPVPELYDIVQDPREETNLVYLQKRVFEELSAEAETLMGRASQKAYETDYSKIDEDSREKLAALGYIGSFTDSAKLKGKKLGNPKEKILVFNELSRARDIGMEGKPDEAIRIIQGIVATDPDITDAYFSMGNICFQNQRFADAAGYFRQVLERKPDDSFAAINTALSYEGMGKFDEAEKFLLDYLAMGFEEAQMYFMLGSMNFIQQKYDKAIPYLEKCLTMKSESAVSHNMLAAIYIIKDEFSKASGHLQQALQLNPDLSNVHYNQAQIAEKRGDFGGAEAAYLRELEVSPKHLKAMFNLSRVYRLIGNEDKELEYLNKCQETDPTFPIAYFYLARIYIRRGQNFEEAIALTKKGIELKPAPADLPLGYFLLADLYNRIGDVVQSEEYARKGQAAAAVTASKQK